MHRIAQHHPGLLAFVLAVLLVLVVAAPWLAWRAGVIVSVVEGARALSRWRGGSHG